MRLTALSISTRCIAIPTTSRCISAITALSLPIPSLPCHLLAKFFHPIPSLPHPSPALPHSIPTPFNPYLIQTPPIPIRLRVMRFMALQPAACCIAIALCIRCISAIVKRLTETPHFQPAIFQPDSMPHPCPAHPYPSLPCPSLPCPSLPCSSHPCPTHPIPSHPYPAHPCPDLPAQFLRNS